MRRHLLLFLLVALAACLGSECSGSGSSNYNGGAGTSAGSDFSLNENEDGGTFVSPVPEPGAALVFGVGLLIAGAVARRNRK